jgi:hypothetical protein
MGSPYFTQLGRDKSGPYKNCNQGVTTIVTCQEKKSWGHGWPVLQEALAALTTLVVPVLLATKSHNPALALPAPPVLEPNKTSKAPLA